MKKGRNWTPFTLLTGKQNGSVVAEICWFLGKLKIELPHDPTFPLLGIHPKGLKTNTHTRCSQQHYPEWPKGGNP